MIFVDTLAQLQINNLCHFEKPYLQPVIMPSDINLQGRLPEQLYESYQINIGLYNCKGNIYLGDVTRHFRILFAKSIYNFKYFNLQLKEWGEEFSQDCFLFKVEIRNMGHIIFNKITEPYSRKHPNKRCYVEIEEDQWNYFTVKASHLVFNDEIHVYDLYDLPNDIEIKYQQGTKKWQLYFDCTRIKTVKIFRAKPIAFSLSSVIGGGSYINLPIYAIYAVDDLGCRIPFTRLESTYECLDNVTGIYYGDPRQLLFYQGNDPDLKYSNSQWIESELIKQPTEFKKEVSFLGRTQRVEYNTLFKYTGLIPFPIWKMEEMEATFSGKNIYIDSQEYIHKKGAIFKKDTIRNTCSWLFECDVEKKVVVNEFSCIEECITKCYYFVIYGGEKDQAYYEETGKLIGFTFNELLDYFKKLTGIIEVEEVDISKLDCSPIAVIKINTYGTVPSFIYYWEFTPTNRIYVKRDSCTNPTILCEGIEGLCSVPSKITSTFIFNLNGCSTPTNITSTFEEDKYDMGVITPIDDWELLGGFDIKYNPKTDIVFMKFEIENKTITETDFEMTNMLIGKCDTNTKPTNSQVLQYEDISIIINENGEIYITADNSLINFEKGYASLKIETKYKRNGYIY